MSLNTIPKHKLGQQFDPVVVDGVNATGSNKVGQWRAQVAGDVVSVSGILEITALGAGNTTAILTIPIGQNFSGSEDVSGTAISKDGNEVGVITPNLATASVTVGFTATGAGTVQLQCAYTYRVAAGAKS